MKIGYPVLLLMKPLRGLLNENWLSGSIIDETAPRFIK
jgi:hypothetical protein